MGKKIKIMGLVHTGPQIWAAFDGQGDTENSGSAATLITPLHLGSDGDYIDFDIILTPYDQQPLRNYSSDPTTWNAWYGYQFATAIIGGRSQRSFATWFTASEDCFRFDGSDEVWFHDTAAPRPGGSHHMRLEFAGGDAILSADGEVVARVSRPAGKGFTVESIGDGAWIEKGVKVLHTAFKMRALTIRAGGTVHDFGHITDSNLVTCHRVTEVAI